MMLRIVTPPSPPSAYASPAFRTRSSKRFILVAFQVAGIEWSLRSLQPNVRNVWKADLIAIANYYSSGHRFKAFEGTVAIHPANSDAAMDGISTGIMVECSWDKARAPSGKMGLALYL